MSTSSSVSERLVEFMRASAQGGVPQEVRHEAKRLILNQLKASVGATSHPALQILSAWARNGAGSTATSKVLWFGDRVAAERAVVVNGALFEVLDFNDTYIPTYLHATSSTLPPVLALAEMTGASGAALIEALAIGIEVELAVATILMPTGYFRGFIPGGLVGGVGAAAACSVLARLDPEKTRNAIGLAMCTAFGVYEAVGSMALPYTVGFTARSGLSAFELAKAGMDAPRTAFEGDKGMLASYSDELASKIDPTLQSLGSSWRIFGQSYKTVPTETITHAPIECVLDILARANGRQLERMTFGVAPIVVKIADERMERFGKPSSELTARFDLRFCAAAAWVRGRFTLDEMRESAYTDEAILSLRERIELVADQARATFDGAWCEMTFSDGSMLRSNTDAFLGSPENRMSDSQLSDLFRVSAEGLLSDERSNALLRALWQIEESPSIDALMSQLTLA